MIKKIFMITVTLISCLVLLTSCATKPLQMSESKLDHTYASLKLLDFDQMSELIRGKVKRYEKTGNKEFLSDAIKICLSRPNTDGMIEKTIDSIKFSLDSKEIWESAVDSVVRQAIAALKVDTTAAVDQVTYLLLLENLILEVRPEFIRQYQSPKFETKLVEKIAAAGVVVYPAARKESSLNLMAALKSPSSTAQLLINEKNLKLKPKAEIN